MLATLTMRCSDWSCSSYCGCYYLYFDYQQCVSDYYSTCIPSCYVHYYNSYSCYYHDYH